MSRSARNRHPNGVAAPAAKKMAADLGLSTGRQVARLPDRGRSARTGALTCWPALSDRSQDVRARQTAARPRQLVRPTRCSLVDTPGYMVGTKAEATGLVRHASRLLVAGAALSVPLIAVILRRGYGLGAQAMFGGSLHEPLLTVAWPGAHLGPDGAGGRGAPGAAQGARGDRGRGGARAAGARPTPPPPRPTPRRWSRAAELFELDDVIDPAETRGLIAATLRAAGTPEPSGRPVDTW